MIRTELNDPPNTASQSHAHTHLNFPLLPSYYLLHILHSLHYDAQTRPTLAQVVVSDEFAVCSSAGSTFPHTAGCDDELCCAWSGSSCGSTSGTNMAVTLRKELKQRCVCVCYTLLSVDLLKQQILMKQMSLGDVVIITIYPHGLVGGDSALFMGLFVNDKVTQTVINLVILRVSRII